MKNPKRRPLSINGILATKFALLLLILLPIGATKAQSPVLVKDINTPQIANLRAAIVYPVGNKLYYSDGSANGTPNFYTGAANATISASSSYAFSDQNQIFYYFVERTPTSAKLLRYNKARVEVLTQGATITGLTEEYGVVRFIVNGNQLWITTNFASPRLVKSFATPIKKIVGNNLTTTNGVWAINYNSGTATLIKDGFTDIGEVSNYRFAANDGGFNGTELWAIVDDNTTYLIKDLNPGTASSNPRNFFGDIFTATSEGQNWLYSFDYNNPKRLLSAPIGTELKALSFFYDYSQSGPTTQFIVYSEKTGAASKVYAAQLDTPAFKRLLYSSTEGDIIFNPNSILTFTNVRSNGSRDIWQVINNVSAELLVPSASLDNTFGGLRIVAGDDGKLWRLDYLNNRYNRALIKDFGAAKLQIQGYVSTSTSIVSRSELIVTSTLNGNTTTQVLDLSSPNPSNIRDVSTITLPANEYSSNPNSFLEVNGKILFKATDGERGEELWRTDGTTAGTALFKELEEGVISSFGGKSFVENGFAYYASSDFSNTQTRYWKTDGTTIDSIRSTTAEYQTIKNKFNQGLTYPALTVGNVKYQTYYNVYPLCNRCPSAYNGGIQRILGADTSFVFSFNYIGNGASPISSLQTLGNKTYFTFNQILTGSDGDKRGALWGSDGTAAGTKIIKTFTARPSDIIVANNKLYFTANDGVNGLALFTSDGTAAGTRVVANFVTSPVLDANIVVQKVYIQGNSLYFILTNPFNGVQSSLWSYNLNGNAVMKITDLSEAFYDNNTKAVLFNGNLLLAQTNNDVGTELFKIALPEAVLGTPLSNVSDLSVTQTIAPTRTTDTLFLDVAITVKNNGSQSANNVKTTFPSLGTFGLYLNSDAPLRDTIFSTGFLTENYSTWFIQSLGINQTATFTYRLVVPKYRILKTILRTTVKSDQFDGNVSNNFVEYPLELTAPCVAPISGSLLVDYYNDQVTDASPIVIQNPNAPSGSYFSNGASGSNFSDQYIRRARGYLKPSETGNYRFFIAGDDNVDVYLSTDDNPANKQRIAYVQGYTSYTQFDKFPSQTSASINLTAGRRYYVEIVNADKFGDDLFNLNWTTPSVSARTFIPTEQVESFCGDAVVVNAYCASKGVAPWEYAISKVTLNTLNNNSDKFKDFNTLGYSDYTDFTATLTKGQTYPLSITPLLSWIGNLPNAYARVWIDFNQNKTFEANELVLEKTNTNPLTQNVLVPTTALTGNTRMRVSLKNGAYPTACETFDKGEVEDYTLQIADGVIVNNSCRFQDSLQLVRLYNATNGANWTTKWNLATPINTWFGVDLNREGCVMNIDLHNNNLVGTLPNLNLLKLASLSLNLNKLSGTVPNFDSPNLENIILGNNQFSGRVPDFNLPNLRALYLGSNQLSGEVPAFNNLRNLEQIILSDNQLSGTIPDFDLPNLFFLWLYKNQLRGSIPNFSRTNMKRLVLSENQLSGSIPNFNFPNMEDLTLRDNQLTGPIPNFNFPNLVNLILDYNALSGTLPPLNLPRLTTMHLNNNLLSGCIPVSFKNYCGKNVNIRNTTLETQDFNAFCANNTGACISGGGTSDIALTISADPSVYRQYSTQNFRVSAKNNGSTAFTNVKIKFSRPALTVSGGTKVASIGTFQDYCPNNVECSEWTIPSLAANTTATLDVPVYVLNPTGAITATATLLSSNPVDNIVANNVATVTINAATTPAVQPLIQSKPTQLIPVIIQKIAPTITENYIIVELESIVDKTIDFQILNALGNVVLTEKIKIDKGNNKFDFNVSQLPKGMYFIQTSVGKGRNVPMKFVKY